MPALFQAQLWIMQHLMFTLQITTIEITNFKVLLYSSAFIPWSCIWVKFFIQELHIVYKAPNKFQLKVEELFQLLLRFVELIFRCNSLWFLFIKIVVFDCRKDLLIIQIQFQICNSYVEIWKMKTRANS